MSVDGVLGLPWNYVVSDPLTVNVALIPITVTSTPSGMSLTVDGIPCTAPCAFQWIQGSPHTVAVATPQAGAAGTQYAFANWSDGGAASHAISGPGAATTYTAAFTTQYLLTTVANPASAGTISPSSAFF